MTYYIPYTVEVQLTYIVKAKSRSEAIDKFEDALDETDLSSVNVCFDEDKVNFISMDFDEIYGEDERDHVSYNDE